MTHEEKEPQGTELLEGRYANAFRIGHNAFEFFFDFGQTPPDGEEARFHTRIITAPGYAKAFFDTLRESLMRYDQAVSSTPHEEEAEPENQQKGPHNP